MRFRDFIREETEDGSFKTVIPKVTSLEKFVRATKHYDTINLNGVEFTRSDVKYPTSFIFKGRDHKADNDLTISIMYYGENFNVPPMYVALSGGYKGVHEFVVLNPELYLNDELGIEKSLTKDILIKKFLSMLKDGNAKRVITFMPEAKKLYAGPELDAIEKSAKASIRDGQGGR